MAGSVSDSLGMRYSIRRSISLYIAPVMIARLRPVSGPAHDSCNLEEARQE